MLKAQLPSGDGKQRVANGSQEASRLLPPAPVAAPPAPPSAPPQKEAVPSSAVPEAGGSSSQAVPATPPPTVPASASLVPKKAPSERLSGMKLEDWLNRRRYDLRVNLPVGTAELVSVLQMLSDEQLTSHSNEAKMWLGLDEQQEITPALAQLLQEFVATRVAAT